MSVQPLSDAVRNFILTKIPSVLQLEILLHLYATRPAVLNANVISTGLKIEPEPLMLQLQAMQARGLLTAHPGPGFAYDESAAEQNATVADLAKAYRDHHVSIIGLIYSRPAEQIRTFADAFRLRQEKEQNP